MANLDFEEIHEIENCSKEFPLSQDFFRDISEVELALIILCGVLFCLTVLCFGEQVLFILQAYQTKRSTMYKSMQILGLYPVMSLTAMLAVCIPRASLVCDLVGSVYLSWSLFNFTNLMIDYLGGEDTLLTQLEGQKIKLQSPPFACCCPCLPQLDLNKKNLHIIRLLVFQTTVLQPLISFLSVVLWLDGKYVKGEFEAENGYGYLTILNSISTLATMYGLILLFRVARKCLQTLHIKPKFIVLQLVLVFNNLQSFIFVILENQDIPECRGILSSKVRGQAIFHMLIVAEMLILAVSARCFYRRSHGSLNMEMQIDNQDEVQSSENFPVMIVPDNLSSQGLGWVEYGSVKATVK